MSSVHNYSALGSGVFNVTFLPAVLTVRLLSLLITPRPALSDWRQLESPEMAAGAASPLMRAAGVLALADSPLDGGAGTVYPP